jgi:hypothetical protein
MPAAPILNPLTKNKRRYFDEEEDEDIPPFQLHFPDPLNPLLADLDMSSTRDAYPTSHTAMPDLNAISRRAIAKPKSRRKGAVATIMEAVVSDVEFEEAAFLEPWDDGEVEMGGT